MNILYPTEIESQITAFKKVAYNIGGDKIMPITDLVLDNNKFAVCSGSSKPTSHHYGPGGLFIHTREVWQLAEATINTLKLLYEVDTAEVFLSILYHDIGKVWDYDQANDGSWFCTEHKYRIHHIPRSAIVWNAAVNSTNTYHEIADKVTHNILAHHMLREWGSPVEPQTKSAWLLQLCDNLSARMDDTK